MNQGKTFRLLTICLLFSKLAQAFFNAKRNNLDSTFSLTLFTSSIVLLHFERVH